MELRNKVILITGASSGIGRELARQLSALGALVALVGRRREQLEALAAELGGDGRAAPFIADVGVAAAVRAAVDGVAGRFGELDVIINCAGIGYFGPLADMSMADFDRVVKTNIYGTMHTTQAAIPYLKVSRGMIVNITSSLSKRALPYLAALAGTKAMVNALSDGWRMELRPYGIQVLNYGPPQMATNFSANTLKDPSLPRPAARRGQAEPQDVAARIIKAMATGKREVIEGGFLGRLAFFAPALVDRIFYKAMVLKLHNQLPAGPRA